jgi:kinesin family protein 15
VKRNRGLLPRVLEYVLEQIGREERKAGDGVKYTLKASVLEIYNDLIYDLLESSSSALQLREDQRRGVFVEGLSEHSIASVSDAMKLIEKGAQNRHVGETAMNRDSSRSHCVFTLKIHSKVDLTTALLRSEEGGSSMCYFMLLNIEC